MAVETIVESDNNKITVNNIATSVNVMAVV